MWLRLMVFSVVMLLPACTGEQQSGPVETKWDRDGCERCRMVLSEPQFATQIRYYPPGKYSRVAKFDDFGCAVLWLQEQPWQKDDKTEIWVADHRNGNWIDARTATYVARNNTPMNYGLGAQTEPVADGLNFAQAMAHVAEVEKTHNSHGAHHHAPLPDIAQ